jgi:hypothetical protein
MKRLMDSLSLRQRSIIRYTEWQIVVVIAGFLYFDEKLAALMGRAHSVYEVVELADNSKSSEKLELFK